MNDTIHRPADLDHVEQELSETIRGGGPFVPRGNGTSRIGLAEGTPLRVEYQGYDYDPGTLTLTVGAGAHLSEIEHLLAAERQRFAFEVPDYRALLGRTGDATIGGMVATNASGPRRVAVGACRDFCLGVRFVDGVGNIVKNGGRVMKNVTGYDLVKLMAGSHGTLGVLTEVSLKTQPIPEVTATLVIDGLDDRAAVAAMATALSTPFDVTGVAHVTGPAAKTLIRLEGFESSVTYRINALRTVLGAGEVERDPEANERMWKEVRDVDRFAGADGDVWRLSLKPSDAPRIVAAIRPRDAIYDWAGGRVWLLTSPGSDVRAHVASGHATLMRASDETKARLGVFHPENAVVARLSAGIRRKFDPEQKLNRGMMG